MDEATWEGWGLVDENGLPGTPWGTHASHLVAAGATRSEAVDLVVLYWLQHGDVRPLAALFELGTAPSPCVLRYVAAMLSEDAPGSERVQHSLSVKSRRGGRRKSPEASARDMLVAEQVRRRKEVVGYDSAVKAVTDILREFEPDGAASIGEDRVRQIHDRRYGKKP